MHNEMLAVVDEFDREIGRRSRADVHRLGLKHRAVHVLVFNDKDQLLLQKRSYSKDLNKGLWDSSAAGHVDAGEDYDSSAPRELWEELGISAPLTILFKLEALPSLGMEFIRVYRCVHPGPFTVSGDEIDEIRWYGLAEIDCRVDKDDPLMTVTFKTIWRHYRVVTAKPDGP